LEEATNKALRQRKAVVAQGRERATHRRATPAPTREHTLRRGPRVPSSTPRTQHHRQPQQEHCCFLALFTISRPADCARRRRALRPATVVSVAKARTRGCVLLRETFLRDGLCVDTQASERVGMEVAPRASALFLFVAVVRPLTPGGAKAALCTAPQLAPAQELLPPPGMCRLVCFRSTSSDCCHTDKRVQSATSRRFVGNCSSSRWRSKLKRQCLPTCLSWCDRNVFTLRCCGAGSLKRNAAFAAPSQGDRRCCLQANSGAVCWNARDARQRREQQQQRQRKERK